jgi:hypothetical protein
MKTSKMAQNHPFSESDFLQFLLLLVKHLKHLDFATKSMFSEGL